jgi:hypothetical protein
VEVPCADRELFFNFVPTVSVQVVQTVQVRVWQFFFSENYISLSAAQRISFEFNSTDRGEFFVNSLTEDISTGTGGGYLFMNAPSANVSVSDYTTFNLAGRGYPGGAGGHGEDVTKITIDLSRRTAGAWPSTECNPDGLFTPIYDSSKAQQNNDTLGQYNGERMVRPLPYVFTFNATVRQPPANLQNYCANLIGRRGAGASSGRPGDVGSGKSGKGGQGGEGGLTPEKLSGLTVAAWGNSSLPRRCLTPASGGPPRLLPFRGASGLQGGYQTSYLNGELAIQGLFDNDYIQMGTLTLLITIPVCCFAFLLIFF